MSRRFSPTNRISASNHEERTAVTFPMRGSSVSTAISKNRARARKSVSSETAAETRNAELQRTEASAVVPIFATNRGETKKATAAARGNMRIQRNPQIPYPIAEAMTERQKTANENLSVSRVWQSFSRIIGMRRACRRPP